MRLSLICILVAACLLLGGCSTGEVTTSDVQKNMKAMNDAAKRDPGKVGTRD